MYFCRHKNLIQPIQIYQNIPYTHLTHNKYSLKVMRYIYFIVILFTFHFYGFSQEDNTQKLDFGLAFQVHSTGLVLTSKVELGFGTSNRNAINLGFGYNLIRRRNLGLHEDERGGGWGGFLGYRHYFFEQRNKFFLGGKIHLWLQHIDWKSNCTDPITLCTNTGTTKVFVYQPTGEVGWLFVLEDGKYFLAPLVSYGITVNSNFKGENVGSGDLLMLGITAGLRF